MTQPLESMYRRPDRDLAYDIYMCLLCLCFLAGAAVFVSVDVNIRYHVVRVV